MLQTAYCAYCFSLYLISSWRSSSNYSDTLLKSMKKIKLYLMSKPFLCCREWVGLILIWLSGIIRPINWAGHSQRAAPSNRTMVRCRDPTPNKFLTHSDTMKTYTSIIKKIQQLLHFLHWCLQSKMEVNSRSGT